MPDVFRSKRLLYRAFEDIDEPFFLKIMQDSEAFANSTGQLAIPQGQGQIKKPREDIDNCLLAAVICLFPDTPDQSTESQGISAEALKPIPIGFISLSGLERRTFQSRCTWVGIQIVQGYRGRGYGSEAILWALQWAFNHAGLHKVEIGAYESNPGAVKLYEKHGFVREGMHRERIFRWGRFWDQIDMGMLDREWRDKYGEEASRSSST